MEYTPEQKRNITLAWISIIIIVGVAIYFLCVLIGSKHAKQDAFRADLQEALAVYDRSIDHAYVNGTDVSIYINKQLWDSSDHDTQLAFMNEIGYLVKGSMKKNDIDRGDLMFFTSDRKNITVVTLETNK